jgi:hypothetical protein
MVILQSLEGIHFAENFHFSSAEDIGHPIYLVRKALAKKQRLQTNIDNRRPEKFYLRNPDGPRQSLRSVSKTP